MKTIFIQLLLLVLLISCTSKPVPPTINPEAYNKMFDGKQVKLFTLNNQKGMEITVTNFGARIVSWMVPDKKGIKEDVVLGYDSIDGYLNSNESYFGAAIGRYGNRIAKGEFAIGDINYKLAQNNGVNALHGGVNGFSKKIWDVVQKSPNELNFKLVSIVNDKELLEKAKTIAEQLLEEDETLSMAENLPLKSFLQKQKGKTGWSKIS